MSVWSFSRRVFSGVASRTKLGTKWLHTLTNRGIICSIANEFDDFNLHIVLVACGEISSHWFQGTYLRWPTVAKKNLIIKSSSVNHT